MPNGRFRYFLRSRDDEEQILEVSDLWQGELGFLADENIRAAQVEEQLLADLGSAVKVFTSLSGTLEEIHPESVSLSTSDAYIFLKETAELLVELGFHVELPEWWKEAQNKVGLSLNIDSDPNRDEGEGLLGALSAKELLLCSWSVSVAGKEFSMQEFRMLAENSGPLAKVGDTWVELEPAKAQSTLQFLASHSGSDAGSEQNQVTLLEALRYGFGMETEARLAAGYRIQGKRLAGTAS